MTFFNKKSTFIPYISSGGGAGTSITVVSNYSALPDPTTVSGKFYWCENSQGTAWLPGSLGGTYYSAGMYYSNGVTWSYMEVPFEATQAEVDAGTVTDKFVSPSTLANSSQWNTVKIGLQTNGTANGDQNLLNLVEGTNMTITDDGVGNITFDATGGGLKSGIATAATTDVYTTTITGVTSYNTNDAYVIKFNTANSDGATLNINSLGDINLYKNNDVKITGGDISVGQEFIIVYDGTNFQMLGIAPNQMFAYVTNADSVTITKGQPVYAFGASGDRMSVKLANNTTEATSSKTVGLVFSSSIAAGGLGFVITQGVLSNVNTGSYTAGDTLYLGASAGALTNTMPTAPNHLTRIGIVERANAGNGLIYVMVQNGFQLDELSDVNITSVAPINGDVLMYNTTTSLWENKYGKEIELSLISSFRFLTGN